MSVTPALSIVCHPSCYQSRAIPSLLSVKVLSSNTIPGKFSNSRRIISSHSCTFSSQPLEESTIAAQSAWKARNYELKLEECRTAVTAYFTSKQLLLLPLHGSGDIQYS